MQDEAEVAARATAVGQELAGRLDELTDDVHAVIVDLIPDLRDAGTDVAEEDDAAAEWTDLDQVPCGAHRR